MQEKLALKSTLAGLLLAFAGCSTNESTAPKSVEQAGPPPSVALRVLVVNDPELAQAIDRLRCEWSERFGGTLAAESKPWQELLSGDHLNADLILFPTRYLGELTTRGWIRPVRKNVLESELYDAADVFPLARRELVTWGGQVMALPLGVDLPAADGMFAATLADASHDRPAALFDAETMKPLISGPAFAAAPARASSPVRIDGIQCPPLLGSGDRLAAVTTSSRNAASAFKLLAWLASAEISTQVASAAGGHLPVRYSLASSPQWYGPETSAAQRNELGARLERALSCDRYLLVPRIPGIDEYLSAMDSAEEARPSSDADWQSMLRATAAKWEAITDRLGRGQQRGAYLKHLNITDP